MTSIRSANYWKCFQIWTIFWETCYVYFDTKSRFVISRMINILNNRKTQIKHNRIKMSKNSKIHEDLNFWNIILGRYSQSPWIWVTWITDIHWHVPFKCITLMMVVCMLVTGTSIYGVINIMVDICRHGCKKVFI